MTPARRLALAFATAGVRLRLRAIAVVMRGLDAIQELEAIKATFHREGQLLLALNELAVADTRAARWHGDRQ